MGEVILDVQHLSKYFTVDKGTFGKNKKILKAVDDVSFQIHRGETFGLVGESGCGKTTIGKMLVNLYRPSGGKILFEEKELTGLKPAQRRQ